MSETTILNVPVAVAAKDNKISFALTRIPGGDAFDKTFKLRFDLSINGVQHTAETEPIDVEALNYVQQVRSVLVDAIREATNAVYNAAVADVLSGIREEMETLRGRGVRSCTKI